MATPTWAWLLFTALVPALLALDLLVLNPGSRAVSVRSAAWTSAFWIAIGLAFGAVVYAAKGGTATEAYYAGYALEKALSVDNVFVIVMIMASFAIPEAYQRRVLFWGVAGAIVMRAGFIGAGAWLLDALHAVIYLFGAFLVITGVRMARGGGHGGDPRNSLAHRVVSRFVPITDGLDGERFLTRRNGRRVGTPLLAALVAVEAADLIFAVDSIPAIFAITTDTFVVLTSNAFAVLGLRALYFLLAGSVDRFRYLKPGLALILVVIGVKMLASAWIHPPVWVALGLVIGVLAASIGASILRDRHEAAR